SPRAWTSGLPLSSTVVRAISSARARIKSEARFRIAPRSYGVFRAHEGNAAAAASIALWQSAAPPYGTARTASSVAGFRTLLVRPFEASHHSPPISCLYEVMPDCQKPSRATAADSAEA